MLAIGYESAIHTSSTASIQDWLIFFVPKLVVITYHMHTLTLQPPRSKLYMLVFCFQKHLPVWKKLFLMDISVVESQDKL